MCAKKHKIYVMVIIFVLHRAAHKHIFSMSISIYRSKRVHAARILELQSSI